MLPSLHQAETPRKTITIQHFIDGNYQPSVSEAVFEDINPATGETLAIVARGDAQDMNLAVAAAKRAFDEGPWPRMSQQERSRILKKMSDGILARREVFAQAETLDTGKPITESLDGDIPRSAL